MKDAKSYIGAAVLSGLLKNNQTAALNLVNAPALAKELGVVVSVILCR